MKNRAGSCAGEGANKSLIKRRRGRRKADGVLDMRARTSARNARPKKVLLMGHAADSLAARTGLLDRRSRSGKAHYAYCAELTLHVGGEPSAPQKALIDQAARLMLMTQFAWAELGRAGVFKKTGELVPAFDAYRRSAADLREVLRLLGIQRQVKDIVTLQDYLKQRGAPDGQAAEGGKGNHE